MATITTTLPALEVIGDLLGGITGRTMKTREAPPLNLSAPGLRVYGVYRDEADAVISICVLDWPLAVFAGAAMMQFFKCTVDEALQTGDGPDGLMDAVHEILNVCTRFFNASTHVTLAQTGTKPDQLPKDAQELFRAPGGRLDAEISVAQLGDGRITILVGPPQK